MDYSWRKLQLVFWRGKPLVPRLPRQRSLQQLEGLHQNPTNSSPWPETASIPPRVDMTAMVDCSMTGSLLLDQSLPPEARRQCWRNLTFLSTSANPIRLPPRFTDHRYCQAAMAIQENVGQGAEEPYFSKKTSTPAATANSMTTSIPSTPGTLSPAPIINTKYHLAGGLDTPTDTLNSRAFSPDITYRDGGRWQSREQSKPRFQSSYTARTKWAREASNSITKYTAKDNQWCLRFRGTYMGLLQQDSLPRLLRRRRERLSL